ncbi:MAG: class I SAM-dependent RNA methyltransferase [Bdellovibrionaceae bacterium]|nr:class I SAM-dependent RNA methyltransferase [Pseudobdellovibrionaceae bacterium]
MSFAKHPAGHRPAAGDRLEVEIEKLAVGGQGIARHDGFVFFVPDAAPGDRLRVEVRVLHKNHAEAEILEVLRPGEGRREPPCHYAPECGGCNWQHLEESVQHEQKQRLVLETLKKFLPGQEIPLLPFVPSPRSLHYRNRVQPRWSDGRLGYFKRRSHDFLPVDQCLIVEEPLNAFFRRPPPLPTGDTARIELRLTAEGKAEASLQTSTEGAFGFSQVNRFQNEDLIRTVLDWTQGLSPATVWDLYAGSGNFTFPLIERFPHSEVVAVELSKTLVRLAREKNKSKQAKFHLSDVQAWTRRRFPPPGSLVVLDPPRAGAGPEVLRSLAASDADEMIYIACHPVSLARDLAAVLRPDSRWTLTRVQAFEMFPQTDHVETIAQLSRWRG